MRLSKAIASNYCKKIFRRKHQLYYSGNLQFDMLMPDLQSDIQLNLLAAKLHRAFEQMVIFRQSIGVSNTIYWLRVQ